MDDFSLDKFIVDSTHYYEASGERITSIWVILIKLKFGEDFRLNDLFNCLTFYTSSWVLLYSRNPYMTMWACEGLYNNNAGVSAQI